MVKHTPMELICRVIGYEGPVLARIGEGGFGRLVAVGEGGVGVG
jgi:hypothetical protein